VLFRSVNGIINEMRRVCLLLYQTHKKTITVFGHSAGGHLAACLMATDWSGIHPDLPADLVSSGMGISGVYDLIPLLSTPQNIALCLDEETARAVSPVEWIPNALHQFDAWVGGDESAEFLRQSKDLAARWSMLGTVSKSVIVKDTNHFSIVDQLIDPQSDMVRRLLELIKNPVDDSALSQPEEAKVLAELESFGIEGSKDQPEQEAKPNQSETDPAEEIESDGDIIGDQDLTT